MQSSADSGTEKCISGCQPATKELLSKLQSKAADNKWIAVPRPSRPLFSRIETKEGPALCYMLFIDEKEVKLHGVCEFAEWAQGPPGVAHGGATATVHDVIGGVLTEIGAKQRSVTAFLNVNYRRPTPVKSPVLLEGRVDKIDGKKIYLKTFIKSADGATVFSDASMLYISMESKLKGMTN